MTEVSDTRVTFEPRTYSLDSPWSFVQDVISLSMPGHDNARVSERMAAYGRELVYEIDRGSREGRRAERVIRAQYRGADARKHAEAFAGAMRELRALTTGGGATATAASGGAAFVSPFFMWDQWAPYRGITRAFADQCDSLPLPPYGLQIYAPAFSSTTATTQQVEGQAVSETDPSTALLASSAVVTVAGQITLTQQAYDRAFSGGGVFDRLVGKQLLQQLDQQVDVYALNQALVGGAMVAGQSSWSVANLYQDLAAAREKLTDTAGTRLRPTHVFTTSDFYSYVTRQVDDDHRPIVVPMFAPGFPIATGADDNDALNNVPVWSRFTGTVLPGGVLWFSDDNIPNYGTTGQTQIVVSAPYDSVVLLEDDPVLSVFPETIAGSLEVVVILREYCAAIARHSQGTASITSAAYTSALV